MSDFRNRRGRRGAEDEHPENRGVEGRVPPSDLGAEAAVLSAILLRGTAALDEITTLCASEDFYSEAHRLIFDAAVDLGSRSQPVDPVQVASYLRERNRLEQIGGSTFLHSVLDAAPAVSGDHLTAYARRIRNRARMRRLAYRLELARAQIYTSVPDEDTEAFFEGIEHDISEAIASRHDGELEPVGPIAQKVMQEFRAHEARGGGIVGIATGFDRFDRLTGGLHDGDLTIIAARPGLGKTALVMNVCDNVAERGYAGVVFSLEMPKTQLVARLLCSRGRVNLSKSRTGSFGASDWQRLDIAAGQIFSTCIHVDDTGGQTLEGIRSKTRRIKSKLAREGKRLGVVVIDYLQLMRTRQKMPGENRNELIGEITRGLKALAKELMVPVILLSQLNRGVESRDNKRPTISDLRDSGEIEQDADNVILIYRDDYYDEDSDERNIAELIVGKQRNGPTGTAKVGFDKEHTRFWNLADGDDNRPAEDTDGVPFVRAPRENDQRFFTAEDL